MKEGLDFMEVFVLMGQVGLCMLCAFGKRVTLGNGYYQTETGNKAPKIPLAAATTPEP